VTDKDKAENIAQETEGRVKEAVGGTTGGDALEIDGRANQLKGSLRHASEKVKDAFKK
jgi:uncharacterized protein YjbJ (UPF0337 family)